MTIGMIYLHVLSFCVFVHAPCISPIIYPLLLAFGDWHVVFTRYWY